MVNTSTKLLDVVIHLYFQDPETFRKNNYLHLKQALYCWVVCEPGWDVSSFNKALLNLEHLNYVVLNITYKHFKAIEELSYQIARFIDFGEMYWEFEPSINSSEYQWKVDIKVDTKVVTLIILNYIHTHIVSV